MKKNGKYCSSKKGLNMKPLAVLLALTLLVGCAIGGTIAWLTTKTEDVTNTFTVGDIGITLLEHAYDPEMPAQQKTPAEENNTQNYPMIPGTTYFKDPVVTVNADSEDCYLFVKFEETNSPSTYLEYTSTLTEANEWHQNEYLGTNVWYRIVEKDDEDQSWNLLSGNNVKVRENVVKAGTDEAGTVAMPAADAQPSLKYTAYAVQQDNLTVVQAWDQVKP